ncbi:hypothetical protein Tco_1132673 [Tanacetum coccineum]|uniref:Uncharacterized protein n=1 Tax=Tanacetum coccineum TaxID=301880 RepID=A0ABQ5JFD5_9ASTR
MAAPNGGNQIARRVIDDLIEFSGQTSVDGYMSFFKSQKIAETRGFINRMREEANTSRNLIGQLNALIAEMEALKDQGEMLSPHLRGADRRALLFCRDALKALEGLREIVAHDVVKLGVLEQLLAATRVGIPLKAGYVADMEDKEYSSPILVLWIHC